MCHEIVYKNEYGNCIANETGVLTVSSRLSSKKSSNNILSEQNSGNPTELLFELPYEDIMIEDVEDMFDLHLNATMASNVELNISSTLERNYKIECSECIFVFHENQRIHDSFIDKKLNTNPSYRLHQPCESTVKILQIANKVSSLLAQGSSFEFTVQNILNYLPIDDLFNQSNFDEHTFIENKLAHKQQFVCNIVQNYLRMKADKIGIKISEEERGEYIRHKNKKNVHSAGQ